MYGCLQRILVGSTSVLAVANDHHLRDDAGIRRADRGVAGGRRERTVDDLHVAGEVIGGGRVGEGELSEEVIEAAQGGAASSAVTRRG